MCLVLYVIKKGEIVYLRFRQFEYDYVVGQKGLVILENSKKELIYCQIGLKIFLMYLV